MLQNIAQGQCFQPDRDTRNAQIHNPTIPLESDSWHPRTDMTSLPRVDKSSPSNLGPINLALTTQDDCYIKANDM